MGKKKRGGTKPGSETQGLLKGQGLSLYEVFAGAHKKKPENPKQRI